MTYLYLSSHSWFPTKGRSKRFQPSLKGRSARQTASTRVEELSIRYMRPFRTSLTDLYSYGTTVHKSILSRRFMRRVQIMPTSCLARFTGSQCHRAYPTDPCRARGVGNNKASKHEGIKGLDCVFAPTWAHVGSDAPPTQVW